MLLNLTDFHTTKMRASNNIHGGTITSDGEVEYNDHPPIFDERWNAINQTSEKRQEREFDSHHCHPREYKACCNQLTEFENWIKILRKECDASWGVCHSFGEIHVVHVDVEDYHCGSQACCAECQESIIKREFLLDGNSNVVPSTYTDDAESKK